LENIPKKDVDRLWQGGYNKEVGGTFQISNKKRFRILSTNEPQSIILMKQSGG
jgi:hypothetical protein